MRITSKGQVTIPREIRERFGFLPRTEVEFRIKGNVVEIFKASRASSRLRATATTNLSTDDIMALTRR